MNPYINLKLWRDRQPILVKTCAHCGKQFNTKFGTFCSSKCRTYAHREKVRKAKPPLYCWWCGTKITERRRRRFCCEEHYRKFSKAREYKRPIKIAVYNNTVIETRDYTKVPEIRSQWAKKMGAILNA